MNVQEWIQNPKTIRKSQKTYAHFDHRIDIKKAAAFIQEPKNIITYGFYPFIHYTMEMDKYNKTTGKVTKKREICYAAHMDRCIYQYYSFLLNEYYNERIKQEGIEKVPVAYRTDLRDSNIQSAKKAFDFIKKHPRCYVMIGDFTNFFDNLDHRYLKQQWCSLLKVTRLPQDHYAVYKNITRYSKWELEDLLKLNGLPNSDSGRRILNKKKTVLTKDKYTKNRCHIEKNKQTFGIPQGSPISATLANVYMLDADKLINENVLKHNGFYMRYSDDFMIVLPEQEGYGNFQEIIEIIKSIPNLHLENKKTQFFRVDLPTVINVSREFAYDADDSNKEVNFLGFSYDGKYISLRAKTVSKYYYRMNRKAKSIASNKDMVGADNLYKKYSERGATGKRGNFFTYINNAEKEFGEGEKIRYHVRRHMSKIRKCLQHERKL